MSQCLGRPVLGWEIFLRRINSGDERSATALYGVSPPPRTTIVRPLRSESYTPLLYGVAPPLLYTLYASANLRGGTATSMVWLICAAGGTLWAFTISRFVDFVRNAKIIDQAILAVPDSARHHEGDTKAEAEVSDEPMSTDSVSGPTRSDDDQIDSTGAE